MSVYDETTETWATMVPKVIDPPPDAASVGKAGPLGVRLEGSSSSSSASAAPTMVGLVPRASGGGPAGRFGHSAVWLGAPGGGDASRSPPPVYGNEADAPGFAERAAASAEAARAAGVSDGGPELPAPLPPASGDMWVFGGRLQGGHCSNEVWLLHWSASGRANAWEFAGPSPDAWRRASAEASHPTKSAAALGLSSASLCLDYRSWPPAR